MVIAGVTREDDMKPERLLFESAVRAFESLLSEHFWFDLTDLLTSDFALNTFFIYGPNKIKVSLGSEFFLGHYANDAMLLTLTSRDESGWSQRPRVCLNESVASERFALSAIYGISGSPTVDDPHRLLTNLLAEIESRISLLRVYAARCENLPVLERANSFEAEYNRSPRLFPKTTPQRLLMEVRVSWWG
jgi:hypothetical protein